VLIDVKGSVALLTLNRPDRLNAWTAEMQVRLFDLLEGCSTDEQVRAIVVSGAGRGFCAGADMENLQSLSADRDQVQPSSNHDRRPMTFPRTIPKPIIAAINGPCAGLGFSFALMCDLRFAAEDAKLTTAFARRGLVAEHGCSWILPRLIGTGRALDLLLSGRVVTGSEAADMGVVNRALPADRVVEEALEYARTLATHSSPASMAAIKRQVYEDRERGLEEALAEANKLMFESFSRPDFAEGVQSFTERRPPQFSALR
jgi:enoyl-CoA hydratase/carnithine racemase